MATPPDPGTENGVFVTYRGMAMVTVYPAPGSKIHTRRVLGSDGYWYFIPPDAEVVPDAGGDRSDDLPPADAGSELVDVVVRSPRPSDAPTKPLTNKYLWRDGRFVKIEDVPLEEWD